jgi:hypothetical protein
MAHSVPDVFRDTLGTSHARMLAGLVYMGEAGHDAFLFSGRLGQYC